MKVQLWGTRGSVPTPRATATRYGGNTSCVSVRTTPRSLVVLDAGTGICSLNAELDDALDRVDILLSHLHMDHIIGLGFFSALFRPGLDVHLWGPSSVTLRLGQRLARYLSPPLFPVRLRDLPCRLSLHDVPEGGFAVPGLVVTSARVCHPGPTVGYRLDDGEGVLTYLSDHEPALGARSFPDTPVWTSGHDLAADADVLIHDAQYTDAEYATRIGWGHSTFEHAVLFARSCGVGELILFHHDPSHDDVDLDAMHRAVIEGADSTMKIVSGREGQTFTLGTDAGAEVAI